MDKTIRNFNELISNASDYLESKLSYSLMTVEEHRKNWKRLRTFVVSNGIRRFNRDAGKQFLHYEFECRRFEELSHSERQFYRSIMMLADFQETGQIQGRSRFHQRPFIFRGTIGDIMTGFLDYIRFEKRLSLGRIHHYEPNLYRFLNYCDEKDISSIQDVNLAFVLHFIGEIGRKKEIPVYAVVSVLRSFLKYTFEQKLISIDISVGIPKYKTVNQPQLPSTYSTEEIEKLICSVDRSSPVGKRNYVIILLAARLGLRASDVTRLKFEGLHWSTSTIEIIQVKTGKELVLPLLPDVGNSIIDYLR